MKLVIDNNIYFSLIKPSSVASYLFSLIRADFFAPEFIRTELDKYKSVCLFKSGLSEYEFEIRRKEIEKSIIFFNLLEYKTFLKIALNSLSDSKDSPYLALALTINASIWSNDPHFKEQNLIQVYTTKDLLIKLLKNEV